MKSQRNRIILISLNDHLEAIGIKYIHYYLLDHGYESILLYLPHFDPKKSDILNEISRFIDKNSPLMIGMSLMSVEYFRIRDLTRYVKSKNAAIPVVWGGTHPTILPQECLEDADYVCVGEGERTALDLANAFQVGGSPDGINNICLRQHGTFHRNTLYPLIDDLDSLPDYEHVPRNAFVLDGTKIVPLTKGIFKRYGRYQGRVYNILSSRGCPFSCTYCCNNYFVSLYQTRRVRRRSVGGVIAELKKAITDNPDIRWINFQDDCFLAYSEDYLQTFCDAYRKEIRRPFLVRSTPAYITEKKVASLKAAGLSWMSLGLQSGSERVMKEVYKRSSSRAQFLKAAHIIHNLEVAAIYDLIFDNPFETENDLLLTAQTLADTPKPFYTQIFSLAFYPGTELHERALRECPEHVESCLKKNYSVYGMNAPNEIIKLAAIYNKRTIMKIVELYRCNPGGMGFKALLFLLKLLSILVIEPVTYFRVIKLSQRNSFLRALAILPNYFKEGLARYLHHFTKRRNYRY